MSDLKWAVSDEQPPSTVNIVQLPTWENIMTTCEGLEEIPAPRVIPQKVTDLIESVRLLGGTPYGIIISRSDYKR